MFACEVCTAALSSTWIIPRANNNNRDEEEEEEEEEETQRGA